jgi:hypothetical protein
MKTRPRKIQTNKNSVTWFYQGILFSWSTACGALFVMSNVDDPQAVATAFALTTAAGLATALGAALVFFENIRIGNARILAIALGFSAGVMLYVSFAEILVKSNLAFLESGMEEVCPTTVPANAILQRLI